MTTRDIETALCAYPSSPFYCRRYIAVPRASWGIESHECDILAVSKSGFAHEIEIKVSVADLKKDLKKSHAHRSRDNKIASLWFAAPSEMLDAMLQYVPERAGIITVARHYSGKRYVTKVIRKPQRVKTARPFSQNEVFQLARLGTMRYWAQGKYAAQARKE